MNSMIHAHAVRLAEPYYLKNNGTQLHRFLEPDFVQSFQRDLQRFQLDSDNNQEWKQTDRFSDHDNKVVLRLPLHRCFYMVSCEVVCERLGKPALDPQKITSAGFVIRRVANGNERSWMLEDDRALGWEDTPTGLRDPDVHRRLCRDGSLHPRENVPTYTGEQTHPMRPETSVDANGKRHTILSGYLPLGGSYTVRLGGQSPFDQQSLTDFSAANAEHLPWPYGVRKPVTKTWKAEYARPIENGKPSLAFFELLRLLLNRYHLGATRVAENDALQELAESIYFYDQNAAPSNLTPENFNDYSKSSFNAYRKYSLWSWLSYHANRDSNRLVEWMAKQEKLIDLAKETDIPVVFDKLPSRTIAGNLNYALYLTAGDAQDFRTQLDQRVLDHATNLAKEMPLPKYNQGVNDVYQIIPFVRAKDDNNKERIYWADENVRSEMFRVAAPFDPDASRPSLIQMPSLKDIRKGMAKGVSLLTPPDTFNLLNALNLKKGASEDVLPGDEPSGIGIQWICSFSLPIITLVAMIILMIMISLLNIVFFWLPFVKICLPFPKIK